MARNLGEARVSVLPDGTRFKPEAEAQIKKATEGLRGKVKLDLDTKGLDAQMAAEAAKIIATQNRIAKAREADEARAQRDIKQRSSMWAGMFDQIAKGEAAQMAREAALSKAQEASSMRLAKARRDDALNQQNDIERTRTMYEKMFSDIEKGQKAISRSKLAQTDYRVNFSSKDAELQAASFRTRLKATLSDIRARINLKSAEAEGEAIGLREKLNVIFSDIKAQVKITQDNTSVRNFLGRFARDAENAGNNGGRHFGQGFISGLGKSAMMQNPGITALVIAGLAALPAAVGAVGVLGGIALGAGIVFGAEKLIKSQIKTVTSSINQLQTQMGGKATSPQSIASMQLAEQNTQATIKRLEGTKKLTAAQQQQLSIAKQRLVIEQQTIAAAQGKGKGTFAQQQSLASYQRELALLSQEKKAFSGLDNAVSNLKQSFIDFAIVTSKPLIKPFTDAVNYLASQLGGPLSKAFSGFFKAVAPLIKPVEIGLLNIVKYILPGMTYLLDHARKPLGEMFINFGKIVGIRLGDWFRAAAPHIKESARYFLKIVDAAGRIGSFLIHFGGMVAKAFSQVDLKGLGKDVGTIANDLTKLLVPAFEGWASVMTPVAKIVADIVTPLLNFLVANPALTKAIAAFAAVWYVLTAAISVANIALGIFDAELVVALGPFELTGAAIGLLIAAIVALGVGIYFAVKQIIKHWGAIAGFFVNIWKHIWSGAIGPMINWFTKSVPHAFGHVANAAKPVFAVIAKVWDDVWHVTKIVFGAIEKVLKFFALVILGLLGEAFIGLRNLAHIIWDQIYHYIVKPIERAWNWLYKNFLVPIGHYFKAVWETLVRWTKDTFNWIYDHIVRPLDAAWNWVYKNFLTPIGHAFKDAWDHIVGWTKDAFNWVHDHIISPLQKAWDWVAKNFVGGIKDAFSGLVKGVEAIWNKLKSIVAKPINFVIQSIWNPFAGFVNKGLSVFGIKDRLPTGKPIKLARGGHVPGYAPGSDTVPAMLSPGEFVLNPTAVKAIGARNLAAINNDFRPGGGGRGGGPGAGRYASGGSVAADNAQILMDAERYKGHRYRWGGPSNPATGWDCSSFVGYVLGHDFGLRLPGGVQWNPNVHGPVASAYNNTPGFGLVSHSPADILPGDLLVEGSGGHVGFGAGPNRMFSALGTNFGTVLSGASGMTNIYRHLGALAGGANLNPASLIGSVLKAAATFALNGISNLATAGLSRVPGSGPFHDIPIAAVKLLINAAKQKITGNPNNYTSIGGGPGGPPGGVTGSNMANMIEGYKYLKQNLFGGNKVAAAGAVASIAGESGWDPFAQGTGGRGLIGWTPPSTISNSAFSGGMRTQLPAILDFVSRNGDMGAVRDMERAPGVEPAAQIWDHRVERAGINDVHIGNVIQAEKIMQRFASGGPVHGPGSHVRTGLLGLSDRFNADQAQYNKLMADSRRKGISKSSKASDLRRAKALSADMARIQGNLRFTPLDIQHDTLAAQYHSLISASRHAKNKKARAADIAQAKSVAQQIKSVDATLRDPVNHLAYEFGLKDASAWMALGNQLRFHSLNPKGVSSRYGSISGSQVKAIGLGASGDVLDALYGGPGNSAALAAALKGSTNVFGQSPASILPYLGRLSGIHGSFKGTKFAQGGLLPPGPGIGFGADGVPFSFNEGGRRERIVPEHVATQNPNARLESLVSCLIDAVNTNTKVTAAGQQQTNKNLGGIGRHVL